MKSDEATIRGPVSLWRGARRTYLYLRRADRNRVLLLLAAVFLSVVLAGFCGYLFVVDAAFRGKIFSGVTVEGVPVGGLTREQSAEVVVGKVVEPLHKPVLLEVDGRAFELDPKSVDMKVDIDRMIDLAYWAGQSQNIASRMFRRFINRPYTVNVPVTVDFDRAKLEQFVAGLAAEVNYPPENAGIDMSSGTPVIEKGHYGLTVKEQETVTEVEAALPSPDRNVTVVTESVRPEVTSADIGCIIVISLSRHTLYLYRQETLENSFLVAVGMPEYPTPTGRFHVTFKEEDPVWLPTSEWAKDKRGIPQPPGPDNPLGKYWMDIGGGIGIHSTPFENSLGEDASHGCIRMSEWGASQVYNTVEVGTPVYIIE